MQATIVLLTDFGLADAYVGQMKAVLRSMAPDIPVLDLCHVVSPHNIAQGSFLLQSSYNYFPPNSIFLCVIDPGVGTSRAILAAQYNKQIFLAPDNGLLSFLPDKDTKWWQLMIPKETSYTFHGRDIFAPIAAQLATHNDLQTIAKPAKANAIAKNYHKSAQVAPDHIKCHVLHIDRFGNCLLDIPSTLSEHLADHWRLAPHWAVRRVATYAELSLQEVGLLAGSQGVMELAMNQQSCATHLEVSPGSELELWRNEDNVSCGPDFI